MKRLVLTGCLILLKIAVWSQSVTGKLADTNEKPLGYANVVLLNQSDSSFVQGTTSKEDGTFFLERVVAKNYILKVSSIGYKTAYINCTSGNLGTIILNGDSHILAETVVIGHRPTYELRGNSMVTRVKNTILSHIGTANDVLRFIPGVQGNDGSFTVFGKGTPEIYINGRKVQNTSELDRLSSKDIISVELINNPGAEYDATVKAVLKIKTVNPQSNGWSVNARTYAAQGYYFTHLEEVNLNYQKDNLDIFGMINHSKKKSYQDQTDYFLITADTLWLDNEFSKLYSTNKILEENIGFNYQYNLKYSMGVRVVNSADTYNSMSVMDADVTANYNLYDRLTYHTNSHLNSPYEELYTYYDGAVGKLHVNWNGFGYWGRTVNIRQTEELSQNYNDRSVTTDYHYNSILYASKLILTYPIGKGNFKVGSDYSYTKRNENYTNDQHYVNDENNHISEKKIAGFIGYSFPFCKFQTEVGMRYEYYGFNYFENSVRMDEQSKIYNNLFPNLSLSRTFGKVQTSLSYTAKTARPSYSILSNNVQYNNRFCYEGGNSLLQPEIKYDISFLLRWKWIMSSSSFQFIRNMILYVYDNYENKPSIVYITYKNSNRTGHYFNTVLTLSPKFGIYSPSLTASLYCTDNITDYLGQTMKLNNPLVLISFNNAIDLGKNWQLFFTATCQSNGDYNLIRERTSGLLSVTLTKSFFRDRFSLNLYGQDIFRTYKTKFYEYGTTCKYYKDNYKDTQLVRLTLRYNFNTSKSKYKGNNAGAEERSRL